RLKYGDPDQQTVFGDDPVAMGQRWLDAGSDWLHIVNLDGAFGEQGASNWAALQMVAALPCKIQFGGGVRGHADVERALALGATRVILGTVAVENPAFVAEAIGRYGAERIVVGLDARDGQVKTRGWQTDSGISAIDLGKQMASMGVQTVLHTDIGRDGVLTGVNWQASQALAQAIGIDVLASGGVTDMTDIEACISAEGVTGVITGRAIYDGRLDLTAANHLAQRGQI
ncbi:MAG: 1-(5-phosphoribosyl)-5-[(5-phosphoribosylamino)methylideneamino] imidazole-4-carboxamide isomerase, partial [Candidatus Promineifilaceae bacterium]